MFYQKTMAKDLRVVLVKLADRMHNMQTLSALPNNKQKRIAKETLKIYAPIAGILGIWRLRWELEDECFKQLDPKNYNRLREEYEIKQDIFLSIRKRYLVSSLFLRKAILKIYCL